MEPIQKIKQFLATSNYEGILLRKTNNFAWISNGGDSTIVRNDSCGVADWYITHDQTILIVDETEKNRIIEEELCHVSFPYEVASCFWYDDKTAFIQTVLAGRHNCCDVHFQDLPVVDDQLSTARSLLTLPTQQRFRQLCQESANIVETICQTLTIGMSEHEIEARVAAECLTLGIHPQVILVSSDERLLNYRHPMPTAKKIRKHVMVVLCGEREGLVANVTRLVHFGPLPDQLAQNQRDVAKISATMMQATQPGARANAILAAGIECYRACGKPHDWQILHQGGLAGFATREYLVTPQTEAIVQFNQAYAWNPMLPGVKCEDTFLVTETGIEILTQTPTWPTYEYAGFKRPLILVREDN